LWKITGNLFCFRPARQFQFVWWLVIRGDRWSMVDPRMVDGWCECWCDVAGWPMSEALCLRVETISSVA
jgi:hypothetical protein